jgi:GNAT superfamily N-acetyltransferase
MEPIEIRPATFADLPHILHHRRAMFRDMKSGTDAEFDAMLAGAEAFLRQAMPAGNYRGWLAETKDRRIAAGAGITIVPWPGAPRDPAPRRGWIQNVYTEPEFRRQGLARKLMKVVVEWCRTDGGFNTVSLHASNDGRPLYESMGFQATNEMRLTLPR